MTMNKRLALTLGAPVLLAALLVLAANRVRPYPFSTTDDNWMYFLPLIKSHTDALLGGHFLRVLWGLGSGWVPWENAQVGVLYFPYHLANLLARVMGRPLAVLELSAWMHLAAAAIVTHAFAPEELAPGERMGWAAGAMLMPGPFLLGLNWHNYLSCYPWFLGLAFLLRRNVCSGTGCCGRRDRLLLGGFSLGFFLSAHAQMYVLGVGALMLWALAEAPRRATLRTLLPFLVAQLPALVPLIFMKLLAMDGTPDWMGDRADPDYLLRHAQTMGTVLHGSLLGNLLYTQDFQLWADISWTGVGMFFSPCLALLVRPLWHGRRWFLGLFFLGCLAFMGAASYPWMRYLGFGPLEGFRWTWKICIFVGPLALVSLLPRLRSDTVRHGVAIAWLTAALSLVVVFRGLAFEIWPSLVAAHPLGAAALVAETRHMAQETGLRPGTRVVLLGPLNMVQPLPLPVLGLVGNAPLLSGLGTAHVYEPMEPEWVSRAHFGLSLPWRVFLPAQALLEHPAEVFQAMARIGVQAVVTLAPQAASFPGCRSYTDRLGRKLWVVPVPGAPAGPYPAAAGQPLTLGAAGVLLAPAADRPPGLLTPRPIAWGRDRQGAWVGMPGGIPLGWALASLLIAMIGLAGLVWDGWSTMDLGDPPPPGRNLS
jgi:hypothetical protein